MIAQTGTQTRQQQLQEIEYQNQMLFNLKKWMRNLILLSSIGIGIAYWAICFRDGILFHIAGGVGIIFAVLCVALCAVVGLALKRGKENVDKITKVVYGTK